MRKIYGFFFAVLIIGCKPKINETLQLIDYVPQNTVIVVQLNDTVALKSSEILSKVYNLNKEYKNTFKNIRTKNIELPALYCITPIGKNKNAVSLITRISAKDSINITKNNISYNDIKIEITKKQGKVFYAAKMGDFKMISESQLVLENSIRNFQNNQRGVINNDFYQLAESMDEDLPLNFFLNPSAKKIFEEIFPIAPLFPKTSKHWLELDLDIDGESLSLNGAAFFNDSLPDALCFIKNLRPRKLRIPNAVPKGFTSYLGLSIENIQQLEDNFKNFSRKTNIPLNNIDFSSISSVDEMGWVFQNEKKALIFHLNNTENQFPLLSFETEGKKYRSISYYPIKLPLEIIEITAQFGEKVNVKWAAPLQDFLIFTEEEALMKNILGNFVDGNTLANNLTFEELQDQLASKSSFLWIANTEKLLDLWKKKGLKNKALDNFSSSDYPLISFQGVGEKNFTHLHLRAQKNLPKNLGKSVKTEFNINLNKPAATNPKWLKNHRSKGMDLAIQDEANVLYLFSNNGNLYWKKQLPGKIIGPIQQVDLYKNKRLQMAFRTTDRFMILDRNGNIVKPFDIKLPKNQNPQPLAVFDYDLNRNYRFLLGQDNSLVMYDNKGKKLSGFKLNKLSSNLLAAPKHIRIKSKDYLLLPLEDNTLKIVSRTGKNRVKVKEKIAFSGNQIYSYLNTFATTNQAGDLIQIDTNGNVVKTELSLAQGHKIDATSKSMASISDNILTIKGIPVTLPFGAYTQPKIFYLNNTLYITTTDQEAQKVYVYYSNGIAVEGFPVYGSSSADLSNIDKDTAVELSVRSENKEVLIYEFN
jgi:hypothetical protein